MRVEAKLLINIRRVLDYWRARRDAAFEEHDLDTEKVYEDGNFEELPYECQMAVHYVDAFASAYNNAKDIVYRDATNEPTYDIDIDE